MILSRCTRRACVLAVVAFLAGITGSGAYAAGTAHPFYQNTFTSPQGQSVPFTTYLGSVVVLNFWATWCPPCVKEMPDLDDLQKKLPAIKFVGLAVDTAANVKKFGEKVQVDYDLLIAGHEGIQLMRELDNARGGLPYTVVFDAKGVPLKTYLGQIDPTALHQYLRALP